MDLTIEEVFDLPIIQHINNNGLDPAYEKFLKGGFRAKGGLDQKEVINFE